MLHQAGTPLHNFRRALTQRAALLQSKPLPGLFACGAKRSGIPCHQSSRSRGKEGNGSHPCPLPALRADVRHHGGGPTAMRPVRQARRPGLWRSGRGKGEPAAAERQSAEGKLSRQQHLPELRRDRIPTDPTGSLGSLLPGRGVCASCGTRYSPPTPAWAAIAFIVAGAPLALFGLFGVLIGLANGNPLPLACEGPLGLLGMSAIFHGIRTLNSPGRF